MFIDLYATDETRTQSSEWFESLPIVVQFRDKNISVFLSDYGKKSERLTGLKALLPQLILNLAAKFL